MVAGTVPCLITSIRRTLCRSTLQTSYYARLAERLGRPVPCYVYSLLLVQSLMLREVASLKLTFQVLLLKPAQDPDR